MDQGSLCRERANRAANRPSYRQVVMDHMAQPERQVGKDMNARHDFAHRQPYDRGEGVIKQFERDRTAPGALELDILELILHQLTDTRCVVDVRDDLQQEIGLEHPFEHRWYG